MNPRGSALRPILATLLLLSACVAADDDGQPDRLRGLEQLGLEAGAEVTVEVGETGTTRVLTTAPGFPVPGNNEADPAAAALRFLGDHHEAFLLDGSEIASFAVARVDRDPASDVRHVTLQRLVDGDPVFHGAITVHMTGANDVFTALGDDSYR
ncbi:MAG TPA: hypothetical protein VKB80_03980, partial [Kofleriaceae bacterium]|nr:hypothetical protein [Kofleriaceae bacterium]